MVSKIEVDLWSLQVFVTVASTGSMTRAAAELSMTQSAVSQVIRRLETSLDVSLVTRGRRPLQLSVAGIALRARAEALVEDALQLPIAVRQADTYRAPQIRLGLVDTFAATAGPGLMKQVLGMSPRIVVWSGLSPFLGSALIGRQVDLIVSSDTMEDVDGLGRMLLWQEPFILLVPAAFPIGKGNPELACLSKTLPLIRYSARSHIGMQIERHLRRIGVAAERRVEIDSSEGVIGMVAAGVGWTLTTPLCLLQGFAHTDGVRILPLPVPRFRRSLTLLHREGEHAGISSHISNLARAVMRTDCLPPLLSLAPWLCDAIVCPPGPGTPQGTT